MSDEVSYQIRPGGLTIPGFPHSTHPGNYPDKSGDGNSGGNIPPGVQGQPEVWNPGREVHRHDGSGNDGNHRVSRSGNHNHLFVHAIGIDEKSPDLCSFRNRLRVYTFFEPGGYMNHAVRNRG